MDNITSPRHGRSRKTLHLSNAIAEGESAPVHIVGHGQAGADGLGPQEEPSGADWDALVNALTSNTSRKKSVAMAYFPDPLEPWVNTPTGWVRVTEGEPGYTLNTGETLRI